MRSTVWFHFVKKKNPSIGKHGNFRDYFITPICDGSCLIKAAAILLHADSTGFIRMALGYTIQIENGLACSCDDGFDYGFRLTVTSLV